MLIKKQLFTRMTLNVPPLHSQRFLRFVHSAHGNSSLEDGETWPLQEKNESMGSTFKTQNVSATRTDDSQTLVNCIIGGKRRQQKGNNSCYSNAVKIREHLNTATRECLYVSTCVLCHSQLQRRGE